MDTNKKISSRSLDDLHPHMKGKVETWLDMCEREGVKVKVYQTYRSNAMQDYHYASGRTRKGPIKTHAKGGESLHNNIENGNPASYAIDFFIVNDKGGADWKSIDQYTKAGRIATRLGMVWGGNWNGRKKDYVHIQLF